MEQELLTTDEDIEINVDHRYPIGTFQWGNSYSPNDVEQMIETIEAFPARLKKLVAQYAPQQLDTPYRKNGWTIRQVVHHLADSHMNAYIRFKLALTEDKPTIKPYNEKAWAEMVDSKMLSPDVSLGILNGVHERWTLILKTMEWESFHRTLFHPEHMKLHQLIEMLAMYAWHCNHHYAHIQLIAANKPTAKKPATKKSTPKKVSSKRKS